MYTIVYNSYALNMDSFPQIDNTMTYTLILTIVTMCVTRMCNGYKKYRYGLLKRSSSSSHDAYIIYGHATP